MGASKESVNLVKGVDDLKLWISQMPFAQSDKQIFLLNGPMGVGKTQFVKLLAELYKRDASIDVSSPTFSLHNQYDLVVSKKEILFHHLDLYRIESEDDLESIGFWDLFTQEKGWIAIEWAERISQAQLPVDWVRWSIDFSFESESNRKILWHRLD